MQVTGTIWAEIGLDFEGEYLSYRPATREDPEEGGCVEDLGVVGLNVEVATMVRPMIGGPSVRKLTIVNLLEGVTIDANVKRLLSNLADAFADELQDAAVAEASE
jgi:hypothetical protein